jgi:hypothetical protein
MNVKGITYTAAILLLDILLFLPILSALAID